MEKASKEFPLDFPFIEYLLDSVSEKSTICNLVSKGTNFLLPSRNTDQLLQINFKYVSNSYCVLITSPVASTQYRIIIYQSKPQRLFITMIKIVYYDDKDCLLRHTYQLSHVKRTMNVLTFYSFHASISSFQKSCFLSRNHFTILNCDVSGLNQKRGGERMLPFFQF